MLLSFILYILSHYINKPQFILKRLYICFADPPLSACTAASLLENVSTSSANVETEISPHFFRLSSQTKRRASVRRHFKTCHIFSIGFRSGPKHDHGLVSESLRCSCGSMFRVAVKLHPSLKSFCMPLTAFLPG
ncbi:hypothetical protein XENOCAPTIV_021126 [Xenoophorus captivus]|uniref:Uncharacterized protein n=1 Tax=Xenoophorus captivus TaxID=1517983 RepID=A0ABV0R4A9_9TELE